MEQFLLELGAGFAFVARQKRIVIDGEDFYLDLLFYHRKLRRLVAVELKLGRVPGGRQGADGALPPVAGEARDGARRGGAARADPLRGQRRTSRSSCSSSTGAGSGSRAYLTELPPKQPCSSGSSTSRPCGRKARLESRDTGPEVG